MKITHKANSSSPLAAVIGQLDLGIFLPTTDGRVMYLSDAGMLSPDMNRTLEQVLKENHDRKPVYEGDSITITF